MKKGILLLTPVVLIALACERNTDPEVIAPASYSFERDGLTSVSYSGQSERLAMGGEFGSALKDDTKSATDLAEMYANEDANGNDVDPFTNPVLNASTKSLRSKTADSYLYFSSNASEAAQIKGDFDGWIQAQVDDVFPNFSTVAAAGTAGQIADGSSVRYVNEAGLEYDQAIVKGLIGAVMGDQMMNNYLDPGVLDAGTNREDNDNNVLAADKNYTTMEHKWDEAYGYLFGGAADGANPLGTIGGDDSFLNKYFGRVIGDGDFSTMAQDVYDALKLGRAAIVAGNYDVRDEQAAIIRELVSEVIGIRSVYYLEAGATALDGGDMGGGFHDLSEGFGFIYSLQFTHNPDTEAPYFSRSEVNDMLEDLSNASGNGFWDVSTTTLRTLSTDIAARFDFTVDQVTN
tara:strand:+ start:10014 stop:11222 length:1209 start_codon:yes stop_codon:yes gene_type:complete